MFACRWLTQLPQDILHYRRILLFHTTYQELKKIHRPALFIQRYGVVCTYLLLWFVCLFVCFFCFACVFICLTSVHLLVCSVFFCLFVHSFIHLFVHNWINPFILFLGKFVCYWFLCSLLMWVVISFPSILLSAIVFLSIFVCRC